MSSSGEIVKRLAIVRTMASLAMLSISPMKHDYGEPKKSRHFTLTDTAYAHLVEIAHEARQSLSETLERLVRSTPTWEGSATLSDGAFSLIEDYSISSNSIEDYESLSA